jgi:hypothetical protein
MYTNIPTDEIIIIKYALINSYVIHNTFITEIQSLIHIILEQNYLEFNAIL